MRMFLVVMCDVFLLLYLTSISLHDRNPISSVTLEDYQNLEAEQASLKRRETRTAARLERAKSRVHDMEAAAGGLQREIAQEKARTREAAARESEAFGMLEQLRGQLENVRKNAEALQLEAQRRSEEAAREREDTSRLARAREESEQKRAEAERELTESEARLQDAARKEEEARTLVAKNQEELRRISAEKDAALSESRAMQDRLASAVGESERAKAAADEAEEARKQTERLMIEARSKELRASREVSEARARAAQADLEAQREGERAEAAIRENQEGHAKLRAVLQPSQRAYERNVESQLAPVRAEWRRDGFFGAREDQYALQGIPVRIGERSVVFEPKSQLGFENDIDPADVQRLNLTVAGSPAAAILVNAREPRLIGLVSSAGTAGKEPADSKNYMPTLLAVRNGSRPVFSDRIRDLDPKHLLFERDRLRRSGEGHLTLSLEGFRGTGDFGELIMEGDQVVDLEGSLLGVSVERNTVAPIRPGPDWRTIQIAQRSARQVLEDAMRVWGRAG